MTNPTSTPSTGAPMQFDRAVSKDGAAAAPGVICSMCPKKITDKYWTLGDQPVCGSCKASIERDASKAKGFSVYGQSIIYGFGAALAGAVLYYAVLKILNLEMALVAIAIGYMVGYSMRKGAKGWGGRRFQLAAAGLTYLSVSLAYLPIAIENTKEKKAAAAAAADSAAATQADSTAAVDSSAVVAEDSSAVAVQDPAVVAVQDSTVVAVQDSTVVAVQDSAAVVDSTAVAVTDSAAVDSTAVVAQDSATSPAKAAVAGGDDSGGVGLALLGVGALFLFSLALPIMVILGSMPGGLISALIIGFGMRQAWRMTAGNDLTFHGPLTVAKA